VQRIAGKSSKKTILKLKIILYTIDNDNPFKSDSRQFLILDRSSLKLNQLILSYSKTAAGQVKQLIQSYYCTTKRFTILLLYSLKNLTNGTKPAIKAVLVPFYGRYRLVIEHFKKTIMQKKIAEGQFEVIESFAIRRRNEFYLI